MIHATLRRLLPYFAVLRPTRILFTHLSFTAGVIYGIFTLNGQFTVNTLAYIFVFLFFYGGIYIVNDLFDYEKDKNDPYCSKRIIASGKLSFSAARSEAIILFAGGIILGYLYHPTFALLLGTLLILNLLYSGYLKKIAYVDLLFVSLTHPTKFLLAVSLFGLPLNYLSLLPIVGVLYFVALAIHADKQLIRLLQGRHRSFLVWNYSKPGLVCLQLVVLFFSFSLSFAADGWIYLTGRIASTILLLSLASLLNSRRVKKLRLLAEQTNSTL